MYTQLCVLGMSILPLSTIFLLDFENVLLCCFVYVCYIKCIYVLSSVLWCPLRFPHKSDVWFVFTSSWLYVGRFMSYLHYLCLFANSGVQHICFFLFCLSSSCVPSVSSLSGLSIFDWSFGFLYRLFSTVWHF